MHVAAPAGAQSLPTNQRLYDTITTMPELHASRIAKFEAEPVVTGRVIFLGNSITQGGDWAKLTGDSTVINRGIGADITFGLRSRLADVTKRRPSKLFVLIGINDISKDIPDAVIAAQYRALVDSVKRQSPETKIFVQSILPLNPTVRNFPQHYDKQEHVVSVNRLLRQMASETGVTYIDLWPMFVDRRTCSTRASPTTACTSTNWATSAGCGTSSGQATCRLVAARCAQSGGCAARRASIRRRPSSCTTSTITVSSTNAMIHHVLSVRHLIRQRVRDGQRRCPVRRPLPRLPSPSAERAQRGVVRDRQQQHQHEPRREPRPVGEAEQVVAQRDAMVAVGVEEVHPELPAEVHLQPRDDVREAEDGAPDPDVAAKVRARRRGTPASHAPRTDEQRPRDEHDAHVSGRHAQSVDQLASVRRRDGSHHGQVHDERDGEDADVAPEPSHPVATRCRAQVPPRRATVKLVTLQEGSLLNIAPKFALGGGCSVPLEARQ